MHSPRCRCRVLRGTPALHAAAAACAGAAVACCTTHVQHVACCTTHARPVCAHSLDPSTPVETKGEGTETHRPAPRGAARLRTNLCALATRTGLHLEVLRGLVRVEPDYAPARPYLTMAQVKPHVPLPPPKHLPPPRAQLPLLLHPERAGLALAERAGVWAGLALFVVYQSDRAGWPCVG
jgi:hypothetical protein